MRANCLPNVSVTIQVNGNNLPEHQVDSGDPTAGLSFVEAIDGAQFSIVLTVLPDYQHRDGDLELCVSLDGCKARSLTISSDWVKKGNNVIIIDSTHDYADGLASSRKFTFGKTKMTDGKSDQTLDEKLSKIGEVTVTLTRCRELCREPRPNTVDVSTYPLVYKGATPEKAVNGRAISCHTQMGAVDQKKWDNEHAITAYPYGIKPQATYKFKFRSRRDLQAEGIIQRSPPPPVALVCRDPDDLNLDEAREVIRLLRAQIIKNESEVKPGKCSCKRKHSDVVDGDDEEVTITRVETQVMKRARVIRASVASSAQAFDLTGE